MIRSRERFSWLLREDVLKKNKNTCSFHFLNSAYGGLTTLRRLWHIFVTDKATESHVAPVTEWSLVHALPEQHPDIPSRYEMGCRKMQPRLCYFVPHLLALETARQDAAISTFCYIMYFPRLCESTRNNRGYTGFHVSNDFCMSQRRKRSCKWSSSLPCRLAGHL